MDQRFKTFIISSLFTALNNNSETIIITLSNPTNCNIDGFAPFGGTGFTTHTYTITDNDSPPTIQFNMTSSSGIESVSPVNFQVDLDAVSGIDASATYTLTAGMAFIQSPPGFVAINANAATQTVTATSNFVYADPISISFS